MRSGGSANPSVVRRADRTGRRSARPRGLIQATAEVAAAAEATPPAATVAAARTRRAAVTAAAGAAILPAAAAVAATRAGRARCIRRSVPSVDGIRKFPSSHARTSRFIAGSVSSCGGHQRPREITTTRVPSGPDGGSGRKAAPFSCARRKEVGGWKESRNQCAGDGAAPGDLCLSGPTGDEEG